MPRVLLFTGKGGVGKTTIAAASGIEAARRGHRTLIMSSDPAHSLADALDTELEPEPVEVAENLWAQEIDLYYSIKKYWGTLRNYILQVFEWQDVDEILAEEFAALPGMEEAAAFLWVEQFYEAGDYDLLIIDSAPTGETLNLLSLPQVGRWWMERIFPVQRKMAKRLGPMIEAVSDVPIPEDETYENVEDLFSKLLKTHELISDPEVSSIRLVLNPERMVIQEARRAYTYLQLYDYPVDSVIVNRILPDREAGPFFEEYVERQQNYLEEIEEAFQNLPIFRVPHLGKEAFGQNVLQEIGARLYEDTDPTEVFASERSYRLEAVDEGYLLHMHLPFLDPEELEVMQYGEELVLQVHNKRRNFFLPRFLAYYEAQGGQLEDGWLKVRFIETEETPKNPLADADTEDDRGKD